MFMCASMCAAAQTGAAVLVSIICACMGSAVVDARERVYVCLFQHLGGCACTCAGAAVADARERV